MTRDEIINAVLKEAENSERHIEFTVERRKSIGPLWSLTVEATNGTQGGLDESLEGATAWWAGANGQPNGAANILSVVPDEQLLNLRFASREPPEPGQRIRVYPPQYLEALAEFWKTPALGEASLRWFDRALNENAFDERWAVPPEVVVPPISLRQHQLDALKLSGWTLSFLWGPPGTGKTYTLGALVAGLIINVPEARVLIVSTTNTAVDQVLVSVDKALEQLEQTQSEARTARRKCFRLGNHFIASNYENREHLLPVRDPALVQKLVELESARPDESNVENYAAWKSQIEQIRKEIKSQSADVLRRARIAALTATRAVFILQSLRETGPWDLIVFDEASQVGIAHALAVAPIARRALFAGDPKQLAPIAQSKHRDALNWIARPMFAFHNEGLKSACMLREQSRMAEPICRLVSNVFYGGNLVVAKDKASDANWIHERTPPTAEILGASHVHITEIVAESNWSGQKYYGRIRFASAEKIVELIKCLTRVQPADEILVLTPFRAQRSLIKVLLRHAKIHGIKVSTVHRAQGSERPTVLFDPVDGSNDFLLTDEARRLINVALSRAQARLVLFLSQADRTNPILREVASILENQNEVSRAVSVAMFIEQEDFPECLRGQIVQVGTVTGRVTTILDEGRKFAVECFTTGKIKNFVTETVVRKHRSNTPPSSCNNDAPIFREPNDKSEHADNDSKVSLKKEPLPPLDAPDASSGKGSQDSRPRLENILQCVPRGSGAKSSQDSSPRLENVLKGLEVVDMVSQGGALWVVGGPELESVMNVLAGYGFRFRYAPRGSKSVGKRPAWFCHPPT